MRHALNLAESVLATVSNVQKPVFILEVVVDLAHCRGRLRYRFIYKQEDGLLGWQLDAFAYDPHELGHRDVVGHQKLALVDLLDLRVGHALNNNWYTVRILVANLLGLALSLLYLVGNKINLIRLRRLFNMFKFDLPKLFSSLNLNFIFFLKLKLNWNSKVYINKKKWSVEFVCLSNKI